MAITEGQSVGNGLAGKPEVLLSGAQNLIALVDVTKGVEMIRDITAPIIDAVLVAIEQGASPEEVRAQLAGAFAIATAQAETVQAVARPKPRQAGPYTTELVRRNQRRQAWTATADGLSQGGAIQPHLL